MTCWAHAPAASQTWEPRLRARSAHLHGQAATCQKLCSGGSSPWSHLELCHRDSTCQETCLGKLLHEALDLVGKSGYLIAKAAVRLRPWNSFSDSSGSFPLLLFFATAVRQEGPGGGGGSWRGGFLSMEISRRSTELRFQYVAPVCRGRGGGRRAGPARRRGRGVVGRIA
jgi:hypothetical protein